MIPYKNNVMYNMWTCRSSNQVEIRISVIFCLSYDLSKSFFIAIKVDIISTKNTLLSGTLS